MGEYTLRFEDKEFGPDFEEKARRELRETPENIKESLEEFRALLKAEPALRYPLDDEDRLKVFLRPCKYYPQSSLERLKKFYRFKAKNPKYYDNLLPSCETRAFAQSLFTVLPQRNKNGERILIIEAGKKWDTKGCTLHEMLRSVMLILEAALSEPRTQISGVHVIVDMLGLSLNHVWQFTPGFAKTVVDWVQDCIPIRLKGIHIVNQPYIFNMVFALFKPLLGEKLRHRIIFHGSNFKGVHKHIDPSVLPTQYQGAVEIPRDLGPQLHEYISNFEDKYLEKLEFGYKSEKDC